MKNTINHMEISLTNCKLLIEQLLMTNSQILLNKERELNKVKMLKVQIDEILSSVNNSEF